MTAPLRCRPSRRSGDPAGWDKGTRDVRSTLDLLRLNFMGTWTRPARPPPPPAAEGLGGLRIGLSSSITTSYVFEGQACPVPAPMARSQDHRLGSQCWFTTMVMEDHVREKDPRLQRLLFTFKRQQQKNARRCPSSAATRPPLLPPHPPRSGLPLTLHHHPAGLDPSRAPWRCWHTAATPTAFRPSRARHPPLRDQRRSHTPAPQPLASLSRAGCVSGTHRT